MLHTNQRKTLSSLIDKSFIWVFYTAEIWIFTNSSQVESTKGSRILSPE